MKKRKKAKNSKVGQTITIKSYRRKVGALPPRTARGRFTRSGRKGSGSKQEKLF